MSTTAKFKLNLRTREIEIEGSEDFVQRQISDLESIFEAIDLAKAGDTGDAVDGDDQPDGSTTGGQGGGTSNGSGAGASSELPASLGEYFHQFAQSINDTDKALITARFVQAQSQTNDFKTAEVNKALQDHGIRLSNPSESLKRLSDRKLLFQTRKVGKLRFMRVSQTGQGHLDTLKVKS